jgi:hypothetical protein
MKTAVIILNRNLPDVTDKLYESLKANNSEDCDFFVIESGSDKNNLSKYSTWWANWSDAMENGLRYARGFNYGLSQMYKEGNFHNYSYFLLVCNDSEFENKSIVSTLVNEMRAHPRIGILSPCVANWGELKILGPENTKYFWHAHHITWMLRREFIESIMEQEEPDHMNFLYDGNNFRGYGSDIELICKGYANDWGTAITSKVIIKENDKYLKERSDLIKTDSFDENLMNLYAEGKKWLRRKYGFNDFRMMQLYSKFLYDKFFEYFPECKRHKI